MMVHRLLGVAIGAYPSYAALLNVQKVQVIGPFTLNIQIVLWLASADQPINYIHKTNDAPRVRIIISFKMKVLQLDLFSIRHFNRDFNVFLFEFN